MFWPLHESARRRDGGGHWLCSGWRDLARRLTAQLEEQGVQPVGTGNTEKFLGLSGVERIHEEKRKFPVGIKGAHSSTSHTEIDDSTPGRWTRP